MQIYQSYIELFKRNSSSIISSPVVTVKCDEMKLVADVSEYFCMDISASDTLGHRYIIARLFWFLIIHGVREISHPKLYSLISKLTNQTLLVNIRSMNDLDEYIYETTEHGSIHSWYSLLKAKLAVTNLEVQLPDTVGEVFKTLDIHAHMDYMEEHLDDVMAYDENIEISLRGLYDTSKSYISTGVIIPLTRKYVKLLETVVDSDEQHDIQCYIKYDKDVMDDYIDKKKSIITVSRKYTIKYPVSIAYESLINKHYRKLTRISFSTSLAYKKFNSISNDPSCDVMNITITCNRVDKLTELYNNDENVTYDINIDTSVPEYVLNFFKLKDILPYEVYLQSLDPTNIDFYQMIDRIHQQRIER